jgi:hypothetical protein
VEQKIVPRLDEQYAKRIEQFETMKERKILKSEEDFDLDTLNEMLGTDAVNTLEFITMLEMKLSEIYMHRKSPFLNLGDKYLPLELFVTLQHDRTPDDWIKVGRR